MRFGESLFSKALGELPQHLCVCFALVEQPAFGVERIRQTFDSLFTRLLGGLFQRVFGGLPIAVLGADWRALQHLVVERRQIAVAERLLRVTQRGVLVERAQRGVQPRAECAWIAEL